MENNNKHLIAYKEIRDTIDEVSAKLSKNHKSHMMCTKGCDLCCMDYSILPVEFSYIEKELISEGFKPVKPSTEAANETCVFLKNHECSIYEHRPVICRTHGLPLLYTNDDFEWELSTCELNFRQFDYENFTPDNTFPQDTFNSKLFMLNKQFISESNDSANTEFDLFPIKRLVENLNKK